MANLKEETLYRLNAFGKTVDDIVWIGCPLFKIDKDEFWELANIEYDKGYGAPQVATDLVIVGTDWWMERHKYDGSEWWECKTLPREPVQIESAVRLTVDGTDRVGWATLDEINHPDEYDWEDDDE